MLFHKLYADGFAVGTPLIIVAFEQAPHSWISSMLVMPAKLVVNVSRGQLQNIVLISTLAVLCVYWLYRSFGRFAFARVDWAA